ncbi:hypothetical protein EK21DRAFT_97038 [Setomelanomma holmii]|uniref:Uncharacterized protein n=1 Tax=Setomelanomma holmii TaxID=210430 RepID=A0A9P4HLB5_9PLEO|nr:hypothetical protein EK21DRAFT_97038 [Setomelanomma holmii]
MASWQNNFGYGRSGNDAEVDAIDLTLSSPEYEQRPRTPPQQQQLPRYFKSESRTETGNPSLIKAERNAPQTNSRPSRKHPRPINPQHLAQIVYTSNPEAIRSVLLELCKISPALSGAVARGLTPHSTFAQGIIKQHREKQSSIAGPSRMINNEESDDQGAYERMKRRLATQQSARASSHQNMRATVAVIDPLAQRTLSQARQTISQSTPRIKHEPQFEFHDSDSDLDSYIPGSFPLTPDRLQSESLPLRSAPSSSTSSRTTKPYSFPQRFARIHNGANIKHEPRERTCTQCHEIIEEGLDTCFYHPGPLIFFQGVSTCDSCKASMSTLGCKVGIHTSELDVEQDLSMKH